MSSRVSFNSIPDYLLTFAAGNCKPSLGQLCAMIMFVFHVWCNPLLFDKNLGFRSSHDTGVYTVFLLHRLTLSLD